MLELCSSSSPWISARAVAEGGSPPRAVPVPPLCPWCPVVPPGQSGSPSSVSYPTAAPGGGTGAPGSPGHAGRARAWRDGDVPSVPAQEREGSGQPRLGAPGRSLTFLAPLGLEISHGHMGQLQVAGHTSCHLMDSAAHGASGADLGVP